MNQLNFNVSLISAINVPEGIIHSQGCVLPA